MSKHAIIDHAITHWKLPDGTQLLRVAVKASNCGGGLLSLGRGVIQVQQTSPVPADVLAEKAFNEHGIELQPDENVQFCFDFPLAAGIESVTVYTSLAHPHQEKSTAYNLVFGEATGLETEKAPALPLPPSYPPVKTQEWATLLIVVLAVLVCGEIAYLVVQSPRTVRATQSDTDAVPEVSIEVEAIPMPPPAPPPRRAATRRREANHQVSVEIQATPVPPHNPPPQGLPPRNPKPSSDHVKIGMSRDQLHSALGEAYIRTYTADHGQLLEVDAFPAKDPGDVTVTHLRDGVVTSAYPRKH